MKKNTIFLVAVLFVFGCQKKDAVTTPLSQPDQRSCATELVVQEEMAADPAYHDRRNALEQFTRHFIQSGEAQRSAGTTITIPVVVHVLYNTAEENISDAQIQSQIDVLNEDFNLRNADRTLIPTLFSDVKADVGLKFTLAQVIRKYSNKTSWAANDKMKYSSRGGSDGVDPAHNLNIWVCDLQKYLGFAYYPGIKPELDGVVILYSAFGRTGTLIPKYDKGRTATHEIGHWANLIHIWGDATCGTDEVDDTPLHTTANFGCPAFPHLNSCGDNATEMTMNYMDYTDDACMFMFSNGQKGRMLAVFSQGGPRAGF